MQLAGWAQPWHLTSGYGLFRRMTGVGDEGQGASTKRPELEVFGSYDGTKWKAIRFRCGPAAGGAACSIRGLFLRAGTTLALPGQPAQALITHHQSERVQHVTAACFEPGLPSRSRAPTASLLCTHCFTAVRLRYKPGDIRRSPPWIVPHQARLDWQMWFAGERPRHGAAPWNEHDMAGQHVRGSQHASSEHGIQAAACMLLFIGCSG